jgi:serine/threonine protein kinase
LYKKQKYVLKYSKKYVENIRKEINVLTQCKNNPNIVQIKYIVMDVGLIAGYIMEKAEESLFFAILKNKEIKYQWIIDVIKGTKFLHSLNISHCDIKTANVVVNSMGSAKLIDFESSTEIGSNHLPKTAIGWGPPEMFEDKCIVSDKYDVYSLGSIVFSVVNKSNIYLGYDLQSIKQIITSSSYEEILANTLNPFKPIILSSWNKTPRLRPTIDDLLFEITSVHKIV